MKALRLAVSALVTAVVSGDSTGTGSPTVPNAPTSYPYYDNDGYLVIRDPKSNKHRPAHEEKIDYSQNGNNWDLLCDLEQKEQSPLDLSWGKA